MRAVCTQAPVWTGEFKHGRLLLCYCIKVLSSSPSVSLFGSDLNPGQGAERKQDCWESAAAAPGSRPSNVTVVTDPSRRTIKLHSVRIKRFRAGNPSLLRSAPPSPPHTHLHFPAARLFLLTDANIHMLSQTFRVFLTSADRYLIQITEAKLNYCSTIEELVCALELWSDGGPNF